MAETAPTQTTSGMRYFAANVAAVICPTSPHSEKKIAANETMAAFDARCFLSEFRGRSDFRHSANATPRKLIAVMVATRGLGNFEMASPTSTATPILAMKAIAMPNMIGNVRYREANTPG